MLNNLLALFDPDSPLVVNQRCIGFIHKRKSLAFDHNIESNPGSLKQQHGMIVNGIKKSSL
jgi:hypothetical protein